MMTENEFGLFNFPAFHHSEQKENKKNKKNSMKERKKG